jgi:D-3-phosphoglycerate dehydrogenase
MARSRPKVLLVCDQQSRDNFMTATDLERIEAFADWDWFACEDGVPFFSPSESTELRARLLDQVEDVDAIIVCCGAPRIDSEVMDRATSMKLIGEVAGDRFAERIDVEAAWERGIRTVDTTNGTSYPVAEWALAMILISLRNAGSYFRRIIAGDTSFSRNDDPGYLRGELTGRRVGLIGCGHIGRRLIQFLRPFEVDIQVYDPYLPREMADALGFLQTSLDNVLSQSDAIVCLAPLTPGTKGMIGKRELDLIPSDAVFVNVSRGPIVDSHALIERLKRGDIIAGLDVFDPEPIPADSEIIHLPNVFLSPHIAGVTAPGYPRLFTLMVDELDRFFHGHETRFDLTPRSLADRRGTELER